MSVMESNHIPILAALPCPVRSLITLLPRFLLGLCCRRVWLAALGAIIYWLLSLRSVLSSRENARERGGGKDGNIDFASHFRISHVSYYLIFRFGKSNDCTIASF